MLEHSVYQWVHRIFGGEWGFQRVTQNIGGGITVMQDVGVVLRKLLTPTHNHLRRMRKALAALNVPYAVTTEQDGQSCWRVGRQSWSAGWASLQAGLVCRLGLQVEMASRVCGMLDGWLVGWQVQVGRQQDLQSNELSLVNMGTQGSHRMIESLLRIFDFSQQEMCILMKDINIMFISLPAVIFKDPRCFQVKELSQTSQGLQQNTFYADSLQKLQKSQTKGAL